MGTKRKKVDRRILRTRALLRDALMRLIIEKGYDNITIQDITDEANVARTTFYLHFGDKDELLFTTMRDMYDELYAAANRERPGSWLSNNIDDCIADDFEHVSDYGDFYHVMLSERGSAAFLTQVRRYLAESIISDTFKHFVPDDVKPNLPHGMMAYAMAGAEIGVIKWWLDNGMQQSPREVAFMLEQLMKKGILWGLGVMESTED